MSKDFEARPLTVSVRFEGHAPTLRVYADPPAEHPFYAKVGMVASEWAHTEHMLDLLIWELSGINAQWGACITAQIPGISGRCKTITALGKLRGIPEPILKRTRDLMRRSYDVADHRARIVHDPWFVETQDGQAAQFKAMSHKDPRFGIVDISEDDIAEILKRVRKLKDRTRALLQEYRNELEASRERHG